MLMPLFNYALPRDVSAALRLLNMTERKSPVIPSEVEESRGNERGGLTTVDKKRKAPIIDLYGAFLKIIILPTLF